MGASEKLPIIVIGAGPVGLAAAAQLLDRGIEPLVLEAAETVGAHLLDYGHLQLFSPCNSRSRQSDQDRGDEPSVLWLSG